MHDGAGKASARAAVPPDGPPAYAGAERSAIRQGAPVPTPRWQPRASVPARAAVRPWPRVGRREQPERWGCQGRLRLSPVAALPSALRRETAFRLWSTLKTRVSFRRSSRLPPHGCWPISTRHLAGLVGPSERAARASLVFLPGSWPVRREIEPLHRSLIRLSVRDFQRQGRRRPSRRSTARPRSWSLPTSAMPHPLSPAHRTTPCPPGSQGHQTTAMRRAGAAATMRCFSSISRQRQRPAPVITRKRGRFSDISLCRGISPNRPARAGAFEAARPSLRDASSALSFEASGSSVRPDTALQA